MPGPPPRQHKHERQYASSTHSVIPTRRIWNDDDDGQMIFGDLGSLKFPNICLTGEEKPRKNLTQETCPDRGSNPGPLRDKRACYHLLHSGGQVINCTFIRSVRPNRLLNVYRSRNSSMWNCISFQGNKWHNTQEKYMKVACDDIDCNNLILYCTIHL